MSHSAAVASSADTVANIGMPWEAHLGISQNLRLPDGVARDASSCCEAAGQPLNSTRKPWSIGVDIETKRVIGAAVTCITCNYLEVSVIVRSF